ncbi:MAG: autotransporter domain-containing protein [Deltaproteobacteria bacterium]|jgi:CubicO group peptidase (beta-lactamase class C family)|nr:autotransporter domain-containing protein [Deltaproteobacteria bacterium]
MMMAINKISRLSGDFTALVMVLYRLATVIAIIGLLTVTFGSTTAQSAVSTDQVAQSMAQMFGALGGKDLLVGVQSYPSSPGASYYYNQGDNTVTQETNGSYKNFRIGSQTKMFTVGTILSYMANDTRLSLDTTISQLLNYSTVADKFEDPADVKKRIGHYTVRQLLNMSTDIRNYLEVAPTGAPMPVLYLWMGSTEGEADNGFGKVPGYSASDTNALQNIVALAIKGEPVTLPAGMGEYSNSNSVILALIIEGLSGKSFNTYLENYIKNSMSLSATYLQTTQGDPTGLNDSFIGTGTFYGLPIKNLEPTLAGVSGAIISSMPDMLKALQVFYSDSRRRDPNNGIWISLHDMPTFYNLGLMELNFAAFGNPLLPPLVSYGHGGAISGATSFSSYITSTDPTNYPNFDIGLSVYYNSSATISKGGIFTGTASESLFLATVEHLYRQYRSTHAGATLITSGVTTTIAYGGAGVIKGGFTNVNQISATDLTISGAEPGQIAYFSTDNLVPSAIVVTRDPVYTYYGTKLGGSAITVNGVLTMPKWARLEGWANGVGESNLLYLLSLGGSSAGDISGEVAVYGSYATAVKSTRTSSTNVPGLIEAHGLGSTALEIDSAATSTISGGISAVSSRVTGLRLKGGGTTNLTGIVMAESYALSLEEDEKYKDLVNMMALGVITDPEKNGAVAVALEHGLLNIDGGVILAKATYPYTGRPARLPDLSTVGVLVTGVKLGSSGLSTVNLNGGEINSDGLGVDFVGSGGFLNVQSGRIRGQIASIRVSDSAAATIVLKNALLSGQVLSKSTGLVSLKAVDSQIYSYDLTHPVIESTTSSLIQVDLSGTTLGWAYPAFPKIGETYRALSGVATNSVLNGVTTAFVGAGVFELAQKVSPGSVEVTVLGLGPKYGANARAIYQAFSDFSLSHSLESEPDASVWTDLLLDANNLSPESSLTQMLVGLDVFRQSINHAFNEARIAFNYQVPASAPAAGESDGGRWRVFANYQHFLFDRDNSRATSGFETNGDSLVVGAGWRLDEFITLAGYLGLGKSDTEFDRLSATIDSDQFLAGFLVGVSDRISADWSWDALAGVSVGKSQNEYNRRVGVLYPQAYSGNYDQTFIGANLDLLVKYKLAESTYLIPRLGLSFVWTEQDGLNEKPTTANFMALTTESAKDTSFQTHLGVGVSHELPIGESHALKITASTGWERQFGDMEIVTRGRFAAQANSVTPFRTITTKDSRDALVLGLALDFNNLNDLGFGIGVSYYGRLSSGQRLHQFILGLKYSF